MNVFSATTVLEHYQSRCSSAKQACFSQVAGFRIVLLIDYNLIFVSVSAMVTGRTSPRASLR